MSEFVNFFFSNTISTLFSLTILLFLGLALRDCLRNILRYRRREPDDLAAAGNYLDALPAGRGKNKNTVSARDVLLALMKHTDEDSAIGRRVRLLEAMKGRVRLTLDTLRANTSEAESRKPGMEFPGLAVNLVILLGLFGTFIGLAFTVQDIPDFLGQVARPGGSSIKDLFDGIHTAFSTSILGMFSAIVIIKANFLVRKESGRFLDRLEEFSSARLLPIVMPSIQEESLLEKLAGQVRETYELLQGLYKKNAGVLEDLNGIEKGFLKIIAEVRKSAGGEEREDLGKITGLLNETNTAILRVLDAMGRADDLRRRELEMRTLPVAPPPAAAAEQGRRFSAKALYKKFDISRLNNLVSRKHVYMLAAAAGVAVAVAGVVFALR